MKVYKEDWKWFGYMILCTSAFLVLFSLVFKLSFEQSMILVSMAIGFLILVVLICVACVWIGYKWLAFKDKWFTFGGLNSLIEGAYGTTNRGKKTTSTYEPVKSTYYSEVVPPRAEFFGKTDGEEFKVVGEPEEQYLPE